MNNTFQLRNYFKNIDSIIYFFLISFFFLTFINRDFANVCLILVLLLSIIQLKVDDLKLIKYPIFFIIIFFLSLFLNFQSLHTELQEYDNYFRLILCLPIFFYFMKNKINYLFCSHFLIACSTGIILKFIIATDASMYADRYLGSSSSAITYANMIMTVIIVLIYFTLANRISRIKNSLLILFSLVILLYIWSLTLTRGSIIGLLLASLLIIYFIKENRVFVFSGFVSLILAVYFSPVGERIDNFFINLNSINFSEVENSTIENRSLNQRFAYTTFAIEKIIENPLSGIGASNVENTMTHNFRVERGILVGVSDHVHNEYLDIALKFGVISLILYFIIWFSIFLDFVRSEKNFHSYMLIMVVISHMGYMLTQSIFAHHQASVFFIILIYVLLPHLYQIDRKTL